MNKLMNEQKSQIFLYNNQVFHHGGAKQILKLFKLSPVDFILTAGKRLDGRVDEEVEGTGG